MVSIIAGATLVAFLCPSRSADAQTVIKDTAYWHSCAAAMKPLDTVKVKTLDGPTFRGRFVSATADDILIVHQRAFRRGVEQRIRFDAVKSMSRTHPLRNQIIAIPVTVVLVVLATGAMMGG
jgi:hypothetical protein